MSFYVSSKVIETIGTIARTLQLKMAYNYFVGLRSELQLGIKVCKWHNTENIP